MNEQTNLEKITGSFPAGVAGTTVAVLGSAITPLAAFVPFLLQSLATNRHSKRVDAAIKDINSILEAHRDAIRDISDAQYRLICETISSLFQSVDQDKIDFLKLAITNALSTDEVTEKNTDYLSRIIRDISVSEVKFLTSSFQYESIFFGDMETTDKVLSIKHGSEEEVIISGLINMGLLYSKTPTFDSVKFEFSPIVAKLLVLLKTNP